jgi:hypothetical protein
MDLASAWPDASRMDAPHDLLREEEAGVPICSVPGCGGVARVRRLTAEPLEWELGVLDPFIAVTFLCAEHVGGVDPPEGS